MGLLPKKTSEVSPERAPEVFENVYARFRRRTR